MNNFEYDINKELNKAEIIPESINKKWEETKNLIKLGEVKKDKKKSNVIPIIIKSAAASMGTLAAGFAVVLTIGFYNPVFAESIPFVDSIISYFKDSGSNDTIINVTDVEERAQPLVEAEETIEYAEQAGFTVNEAYSDGNVLVFSYTVDATLESKDFDRVIANSSIKINGQTVSGQIYGDGYSLSLYNMENGTYVGTQSLNIHEYATEGEAFTLEVVVDELIYISDTDLYLSSIMPNTYIDENGEEVVEEPYMTAEEAVEYYENLSPKEFYRDQRGISWTFKEPVKEEIEPISFKGEVKIDRENVKEYDVNFNENGFSVTKLVTSPINTYIEYNTPTEHYCDVYDNMGNLIEDLHDIDTVFGKRFMMPLFEGTTELTFKFYPISDTKDVTSYTVSVDGGYITEEDYQNRHNYAAIHDRYEESDYTFTPDLRHLTGKDYTDRFEGDVILNLGETFTLETANIEQNFEQGAIITGTATQEVTLSNMQVYDSISEAGIDMADTIANSDSMDGAKFVTVDVNIKNNDVENGGYDGVGDNVFYIGEYVRPQLKDYNEESVQKALYTEIDYFSIQNNTAKGYYMFDMDVGTEVSATVGFFYSEELLNEGNIQFMIENSEYRSVDGEIEVESFCYIYDVPKQ